MKKRQECVVKIEAELCHVSRGAVSIFIHGNQPGRSVIIITIMIRTGSQMENKPHENVLYAESGQTLQGSFSAVSKPNFATKYSLESSRRDLHNALLCTALKSYFFLKVARNLPKVAKLFRKFAKFVEFCKL